ncbi:DUF427-domain-containing protein [Guyanagaster necrorhizus]|uniref:DUF427-domain-containing protein n=1 Tax=Guyanagaster necrorhizus TaxID=856835 RepID=A0A9P7W2Y4_9AGAR|nr:DUF427-domain-containing protein [Guyanagaster necrorhizus MCA 3950]KAG7451223.1 DUF427-domain-containing protein [Guyanagaster necrorhizus MCA 3950]
MSAVRIERSLKRIRVLFGGVVIVDTKSAKLIWDSPFYPLYYFNVSELPEKHLQGKQATSDGSQYDVVVGARKAPVALQVFSSGDRAGFFKLNFGAMDAWFEEEEQIFVHPKDPYKRVDVLQSSRHIRIEIDGVQVANTTKPRLLFETSLPVRTYIPKTDCRLDLLVPSDLKTSCPYKGEASYYHVQLSPDNRKDNVVWWYRNANLECASITGFVAFYDEKVDVWVDGEKQTRPSTHWS